MPATGYLWIGSARREFEVSTPTLQAAPQRWTGGQLVDLHIADLLNSQLPSHFDYTSWYDLMVFRRLAAGAGTNGLFLDESSGTHSSAKKALAAIDTSPVGFAVFDRVLITVHPTDCMVRDFFANKLQQMTVGTEPRQDQRPALMRLTHHAGRPDAAHDQPHGRQLAWSCAACSPSSSTSCSRNC